MRKWIPVALIALAVLWFVLTNLGASMAVSDLAARPISALERDGRRVPVQPSGRAPRDGEARGIAGQGVMFGFSLRFALPDGATVTCTQRFRSLLCSDGWQPLR
ncbi:hypothetical protein [Rhodobacter calidifons]|uniref:Uncharacterized protein n=1 Tax=Rhodobacter calidifons TaxID=2715277 RepID=A0ABX0G601_9RHOB|nr:hypothetical protein [Rhodobacter calidifons]NHB76712.1 hypothetical protein [Rhodobacter calidifons]